LKLKGLVPGEKIPRNLLKQVSDVKDFKTARKVDLINEKRPPEEEFTPKGNARSGKYTPTTALTGQSMKRSLSNLW